MGTLRNLWELRELRQRIFSTSGKCQLTFIMMFLLNSGLNVFLFEGNVIGACGCASRCAPLCLKLFLSAGLSPGKALLSISKTNEKDGGFGRAVVVAQE